MVAEGKTGHHLNIMQFLGKILTRVRGLTVKCCSFYHFLSPLAKVLFLTSFFLLLCPLFLTFFRHFFSPFSRLILLVFLSSQRKNAGANMVVGRKGGNKDKESKSEEKETKKPKKGKQKKERPSAKMADPIRSPLFNVSKPIPSSPTAG